MFASVFYLDVSYVPHMLQEYVPMISTIAVLCYSKCFHVASCKCFIWMLHMFQVYVLNVSSALDVYCIQVFHVSEMCLKR
jgi:hypothetical protein